jgi:glyoxylase-like metal-dependent hydrolase (beta-lactamase superfamily II)
MYLDVFADNPYATNCWLLGMEGRDDAVVVDPGFFPERVRALLSASGRRPAAVLATHGHYDHVGAVAAFCGSELPLYIHKDDELALTDPEAWGVGHAAPAPGRPASTRTVSDGDVIEAAGFALEVLHTPGHTPGSVCFRFDGSVFSGDLVFAGSIGRFDFPNSSEEAMVASLRRFLELPDQLDVLPGHMESTNVGRERATNPFLLQLA